jgi:hypothetical protein
MDPVISRFEILNSFESSMRTLLRERSLSDKQIFLKDMLIIIQYVSSIKEGVCLAQEIKTSFEFFLPKIETEWKDAVYLPLIKATEKYTVSLAHQLEKQQNLFQQVSLIISSLDATDSCENINVRATIKSTLIPIALEFKIIKILCQIHNILFRRDQEELNKAIEEFMQEFQHLDDMSSFPLIQLRALIEQIKVVAEMPSEAELVKSMLKKVVDIAHHFISSFCGE